ncbi:hypothetical protein [Brachybacterium huguangmaarense]
MDGTDGAADRRAARDARERGPVRPLPMPWWRALLESAARAATWSAAGAVGALVPVIGVAAPYEVAQFGSELWNDAYPRNVAGGLLIWLPVAGALAIVLTLASRQAVMRLAERHASEFRPPAYERADVASSWLQTCRSIISLAQWLVGVMAVGCIAVVIMDPEFWSMLFAGIFTGLFLVNYLLLRLISRVLQPRWAARWQRIRSRWPGTTSKKRVTVVPVRSFWADRLGRLSAIAIGGATLCFVGATMLLAEPGGIGESAEIVETTSVRYPLGVIVGILCAVLLAVLLIALVLETALREIRRLGDIRRHAGGRADSEEDAAREVLRPDPGVFVGIGLSVLSGVAVCAALGADVTGLDLDASDMAQLAVMRWAWVPAIGCGILGLAVLTIGRHAQMPVCRDLLAAFPTIDPVAALTYVPPTDSDSTGTHAVAGPDDKIDVKASLRAARDRAKDAFDD